MALGVSNRQRVEIAFATLSVPEPIPPATVIEALIAAGLAAVPVATFVKVHRQPGLTRVAYIVALIGTVFGLTIALLGVCGAWTSGCIW